MRKVLLHTDGNGVNRPSARRSAKPPSTPSLANFRFADHPGIVGKGHADLRDLPLGGTWIGINRKSACHPFGSRNQLLPAI
jgi:hypothetical protein